MFTYWLIAFFLLALCLIALLCGVRALPRLIVAIMSAALALALLASNPPPPPAIPVELIAVPVGLAVC